MFRYFWFIFSADMQFRRAIEQPTAVKNTDGLGIIPSPKLILILYSSTQCHCYTFLMNSWQLLNVSDEGLGTQPLEAMNWAEYNSRIFYVLTFPELFQYRICRISLHTIAQISCVHAVLRVSILFFNLTNQRINPNFKMIIRQMVKLNSAIQLNIFFVTHLVAATVSVVSFQYF